VWQEGLLFGFPSPSLSLHFRQRFRASGWLKWLGPTQAELIPQPSRVKVGRKVSAETKKAEDSRQSDSLFKNKQ